MKFEKEVVERKRSIMIPAYTLFQGKGVDNVSYANITLQSEVKNTCSISS